MVSLPARHCEEDPDVACDHPGPVQEAVLGEEEVGAQHAAGEGDGEDRDVLDPDEERVGDGVLHVHLVREQVVGEDLQNLRIDKKTKMCVT